MASCIFACKQCLQDSRFCWKRCTIGGKLTNWHCWNAPSLRKTAWSMTTIQANKLMTIIANIVLPIDMKFLKILQESPRILEACMLSHWLPLRASPLRPKNAHNRCNWSCFCSHNGYCNHHGNRECDCNTPTCDYKDQNSFTDYYHHDNHHPSCSCSGPDTLIQPSAWPLYSWKSKGL